jgi:hypothetical protein
MTARAIVVGFVIALFVAVYGYVNDWVLRLPYFASDQMPISVYGLLVLGLLIVNPLLKRFRFSGREWTVIFALVLVACIIPGPGLLWQFTGMLVFPINFQQTESGWGARDDHPAIMDYIPDVMLINGGKPEVRAVTGFIQGLGKADEWMSPFSVPWAAWAKPMALYMPLILLGFAGTICLSLIVHRQWAYREHLRYPIAQVTAELIASDGKPINPIFRNKFFWAGFAIAAIVWLMNGLQKYYPDVPAVPMEVDFTGIAEKYPIILQAFWGDRLLKLTWYFAVVGLAFLLSSEVSFSVGISHAAYVAAFLVFTAWGYDMANPYFAGGMYGYELFGAQLAGGLLILYAGRSFYKALLRRALGAADDPTHPVEPHVVWACRILILCVLVILGMLHWVLGMDVLMACLFLGMVGLTFLIVTRINVETGLLFVQPNWQAVAIISSLFGLHALGPRMLIILGVLCLVLTNDPRVSLMPLVSNALYVADTQRLGLARLGRWMMLVLLVGALAAVPFVIYIQYDMGEKALYGWTPYSSRMPFDMLKAAVDTLSAEGTLATAGQADGWLGFQRLLHMDPSHHFLWVMGIGMGLTLLTYAARLRWVWWPIHPVLFMVAGSLVSSVFWGSFLIGWLLKLAVTRFFGSSGYRKGRYISIGLIAGETVMGIVWIIVGTCYYLQKQAPGPRIQMHP